MLARKRASPLMPNEMSSSRFSSKRCFCASVSTEYASCFVSGAASGGMSRAVNLPSMRICGGELVVMWRSEPPLVPGVVALVAASAFHDFERADFLFLVAEVHERLRSDVDDFLAVRAN